jgi:hypothetical protein
MGCPPLNDALMTSEARKQLLKEACWHLRFLVSALSIEPACGALHFPNQFRRSDEVYPFAE